MPEISKPGAIRYYVARSIDVTVLHAGTNEAHQVTSSGQPVLNAFETESEQLSALAPYAEKFEPLPEEPGVLLTVGEKYAWSGEVVEVRQTHERTVYSPKETPALFFFVLPEGEGQEWIVGEWVSVGTLREYEGTRYKAIQAHQTQADWAPPNVPSLWGVVTEPGPSYPAWQAGIAVNVGERYTYDGRAYRVLQAHTTQAGWTPPVVPALFADEGPAP